MMSLSDIVKFITGSLSPNGFHNRGMYGNDMLLANMTTSEWILFTIIYFILLFFIMWIGSFIFNESVVKVAPSLKRISPYDFFGLYIITHLLFC